MKSRILLTDYAWPDTAIEAGIVEAAGHELIVAQDGAAKGRPIEDLAREFQPAAILTCWAQVSAAAIQASPGLRVVARLGVGLDNIDVQAATAVGAWVTNVPDYCVDEVSDHAVGMVLNWTRGIGPFDRAVRAGQWNPAAANLRRLRTLTCGIVGFGQIGRATAKKLSAFGATILACTSKSLANVSAISPDGVRFTSLDDVLTNSDVVILHVPLTAATRHLLDHKHLSAMKRGSLLVNVSRGAVVDTAALLDVLRSGHLSGAALDVLESEPAIPEGLLEQSGMTVTPHIAFSSDTSLRELRQKATEEVVRILAGKQPLNPCNRPAIQPLSRS